MFGDGFTHKRVRNYVLQIQEFPYGMHKLNCVGVIRSRPIICDSSIVSNNTEKQQAH